jgi:cytochrome c oxidase assembly protein subunit 15
VPTPTHNALLHRLALLTAVATFPLIFMGGLVTSHGAGMAVPDWPNTWGYNMFTFPPSKWVGGILFEHTHRLYAAAIVGPLCIVLAVVAWITDRRPAIRWTAVGILAGVIVQGVIGGLRVVLSRRDLAIVHGCAAQIFFCLLATFCVMTSRFWEQPPRIAVPQQHAIRNIYRLSILAVALILIQLIVGAIMRHGDAGLAIPDFPTSFGKWLPPLAINDAFRQQAVHRYGTDLGLNRVTAFQIWINFAHRVGALAVTAAVVSLCVTILRRLRGQNFLNRPAMILLVLLATQLTLGMLTVLLRKPADIASAHVAVGSLTLMTGWVILLRTAVVAASSRSAVSPGPTAQYSLVNA